MSDDDLERLLGDAFDARARASVPDVPAPPPRFAAARSSHRAPGTGPRRRRAWLTPVAAAATVIAVLALSFGLTRGSTPAHRQAGGTSHPGASASPAGTQSGTPSASQHAKPVVITKPVQVKLLSTSGASYGVGMPVIALISHRITDARAFQQATHVTVNGNAVNAAWYFEQSDQVKGYPLAAHLRMQQYWPAHASIRVSLPVRGVAAGAGWRFADDLTLSFRTGAAMISTVSDRTHEMTVDRDGRHIATFRVSLGAANTPTASGTKVVMAKGTSICMRGPGYDECGVKYTQRLTYSGEYLHAAPWNVQHIEAGVDSSNGCTNLLPKDAQELYALSEVGDVVRFPNANGPKMTPEQGLGDWNVSWSTWLRGGAVRTH